MKNLERVCKLCPHAKRRHRDDYVRNGKGAICFDCNALTMRHEFELDNLRYLEEHAERRNDKKHLRG